jgi:hypothetical protein
MADGHKLAVLPVSRRIAQSYSDREPLKGKPMNGISDWFQNNWIDLARLLVQCAILAAVVRYGRKLLATMRASQEQVGALLKLSVSDAVSERLEPAPEPTEQFEPPPVAIPEPEPEPEPEREPEPVFAGGFSRTSYAAEREQSLGGRVIGAHAATVSSPAPRTESPSLTPWVSAPVASAIEPERVNAPALSVPARPGVSTWLQAPMRSSGVSPWRKVVRWLQAPTGR